MGSPVWLPSSGSSILMMNNSLPVTGENVKQPIDENKLLKNLEKIKYLKENFEF